MYHLYILYNWLEICSIQPSHRLLAVRYTTLSHTLLIPTTASSSSRPHSWARRHNPLPLFAMQAPHLNGASTGEQAVAAPRSAPSRIIIRPLVHGSSFSALLHGLPVTALVHGSPLDTPSHWLVHRVTVSCTTKHLLH